MQFGSNCKTTDRCIQENRCQALNLRRTAPGHQTQQSRRPCIQPQFSPGLFTHHTLIDIRVNGIGQGMTYAARSNIVVPVNLRLEGKQRQHQINRSGYFTNSALAPGPDTRTDIVNRADTGIMQALFQTDIKTGRIDTNKNSWLFAQIQVNQVTFQPQQLGQPPKRLHETHDRQPVHRRDRLKAARKHAGSANTNKADIRQALF